MGITAILSRVCIRGNAEHDIAIAVLSIGPSVCLSVWNTPVSFQNS